MNSDEFVAVVAQKCSVFFKEMHELCEAFSQQVPTKKKGGSRNHNNSNNNNSNNNNNNNSSNTVKQAPPPPPPPTPPPKPVEVKDPNMPKKPPTAYILYFKNRKEVFMQRNPTFGITEITKLIAKEWGELTKEQQMPFLRDAERAKIEYIQRMKNYAVKHPETKIPGEGRKRKNRPTGPQYQQEVVKKEGLLNETSEEEAEEEEEEVAEPQVDSVNVSQADLQTGLINEDDSFDDIPLPAKKIKS